MNVPKVGDEIDVRVCCDGSGAPEDWLALVNDQAEAEMICLRGGPQWCDDEVKRDCKCQKVRLKIIAVEPGVKKQGCAYDHTERLKSGLSQCPVCGPIQGATE